MKSYECTEFDPKMCGAGAMYRELEERVRAYEPIRDSLNIIPEGASPEEVVAEVEKIHDHSIRFRLDQAGIENRDAEAIELLDLKADVTHLKAELKGWRNEAKQQRKLAKHLQEKLIEQINITIDYIKRLHKAEGKIKDTLDMATHRQSEWGDRSIFISSNHPVLKNKKWVKSE